MRNLKRPGNTNSPAFMNDHKVTTIHFTTPKGKQFPIVEMNIDSVKFSACFDTGNHGALSISQPTKEILEKK